MMVHDWYNNPCNPINESDVDVICRCFIFEISLQLYCILIRCHLFYKIKINL